MLESKQNMKYRHILAHMTPAWGVNSFASELQNIVNEPIYNGNS